MVTHLTTDELVEKFSNLPNSPSDTGKVELIVIRPSENNRNVLSKVEVTREDGLVGDNWKTRSSKQPNPKTQITLMNSAFVDMIAGEKENWSLAGDQLYVDFDISTANLPVGQKVSIGTKDEVILEITEVPHRGCSKFAARFGPDALRFINSPERRNLRLRGVYAKVIKPGTINSSDSIKKLM